MKIRSIISFLFIIAGSILIHSCYYDKEDLLYVANAIKCDTTAVSYSQILVPLFAQQCYGCHSAGNPSGGVVMGSYTLDKAIALNGKLYGSVNYSTGFSPMPKGTSKMSICNIAAIKKWIDSGTPNN